MEELNSILLDLVWKKMNIGERNELLLKVMLVWIRDSRSRNIGPFEEISQVGFSGIEYGQLPSVFQIRDLNHINDSDLSNLADTLRISKAPAHSKCDVRINTKSYSVKSFESAPPALVNHTSRPGFEIACKHTNVSIRDIDELVEKYWQLREQGLIREDVKNSDRLSPFKDAKSILKPILEYFLFKGTGSGLSPYAADLILDYHYPLDPRTWKVWDKRIIDEMWDKLIFSLRSKKGMPSDYPNMRDLSKKSSIQMWTKHFQGEYRGALHIRCGR